MAMSKEVLGADLAALVLDPTAPAAMQATIIAQWTNIAGAIIDHITQNAEITVAAGIAVSTAGTAAAQTGATTATGTGTIK